ncbi:MAG: Fic family protein [Armatimonadetes bacterium]|nr:Fic family protein [Armatimonadota bacterium]
MRSFEGDYLHRPIPVGVARLLERVGEFRGKEDALTRQLPEALERLRRSVMVESAVSSNRLEGVEVAPERARGLADGSCAAADRSEGEVAGYGAVLDLIHTDYEAMDPTPGLVLQLHRRLFEYSASPTSGAWKLADNEIAERMPGGRSAIRFRPVRASETSDAVARLHDLLRSELRSGIVPPLLVIAAYALDFLCIHPFADGNGRMARLLTVLLLYRSGYGVGRYVSLERIVEETRADYYETLRRSSVHWHEGRHELRPWWEYFLSVLVRAYAELEARAGELRAGRGAKTALIEETLRRLPARFRMREIEAACPSVSRDLIRLVLSRMKAAGAVRCEGRGGAAEWRKL